MLTREQYEEKAMLAATLRRELQGLRAERQALKQMFDAYTEEVERLRETVKLYEASEDQNLSRAKEELKAKEGEDWGEVSVRLEQLQGEIEAGHATLQGAEIEMEATREVASVFGAD